MPQEDTMLRQWGVLSVAGSLAMLPAPVAAQKAMGAKHELGVDVSLVYSKPSGGSSAFSLTTPVDVRIGFVPAKGKLMFEPRVSLMYAHTTGVSAHDFNLDLNVLYGKNQRKGMYYTGGLGIDLVGRTGISGSIISLNGGIGTRSPWESAAWRLEGFVRYDLKNTTLGVPNTLNIGARAGLSLWH
jgi:hypothetical protein